MTNGGFSLCILHAVTIEGGPDVNMVIAGLLVGTAIVTGFLVAERESHLLCGPKFGLVSK